MQFFVLFTPNEKFDADGLPADFPDVEKQEQAQTRVLYAQGYIRQVWALEPKGRGAAVLFEADSPGHLVEIIGTFPLIQRDYAEYEISQLAPHPAFVPQS